MSLAEIRKKNARKNSFVNDSVEYHSMTIELANTIKKEVFEKVVKPINYEKLQKIKGGKPNESN